MSPPRSVSRLRVDLSALAANYRTVQGLTGPADVAPVVKADGYGLGAAAVARRLWDEGARSFFTARLAGGEALRRTLGPEREAAIYVLDGCSDPSDGERLAHSDLTPVLSSTAQIDVFTGFSNATGYKPAALHVDTGMNRLGVRPEEALALVETGALAALDLKLVMSHLACAITPEHPMNARQAARFRELTKSFPGVRASLANSGGCFLGPDYAFDLVRPGIALYGGGPTEAPDPRIAAVGSFEARILQVRDVPAGESVGYGATWTAERATRVAVIGAGYADGLPRSAFPGGGAWFEGAVRPFLGRVSMDLAALDVTGCETAEPGQWVELFGEHLKLDDAARADGSVAYELLTRIAPRVERIHED